MPEIFYAVPESIHNTLVEAAYLKRGYASDEVIHAVRVAANASRHGIRTHNAIKALHLDLHYGSGAGGCKPGAVIEKNPRVLPRRKFGTAIKNWGKPLLLKRWKNVSKWRKNTASG